MSYKKVRSIKIDEKQQKVFITCACNNVRPLHYTREEYPSFSEILKAKGKEAVEINLLKEYIEGNLQQTGSKNKYTKALKVLTYMFKEEFESFGDYKNRYKIKDTPEYENFLRKCLNTKLPKTKYVIKQLSSSGTPYFMKFTGLRGIWKYDIKKATKFNFKEEAEETIKNFKYTNGWHIVKV